MDRSDLFLRNLAAFHDRAPADLFNRIAAIKSPPISLAGDQTAGTLNLDLGHARLYDGDAESYARGQVARYLADPKRININPPPLDSDWVKGERAVYQATIDSFGPLPPPPGRADPDDLPSAALISFGIGLGLHLPMLTENLPFRDLILAEPFAEFLWMSLQVLDWVSLFDAVERRGGSVRFVIASEPAVLANGVFDALRQSQFGLIDGTFGFRHYQSPTLEAADRLFGEMTPSLGASLGFVEDECVMIENALANMAKPDARLIGPAGAVATGLPALVVGSGPSLDGEIDQIRRLADGAVVIGAGTGTSALLEHGIVPDLHCEVENVAKIYDGFLILTERHDLSDIPFFGSVTVDPRIPELFGPAVYYFRDSVTSSLLLAGNTGILDHSAPTVANLGCRAAVLLGASSIHLFGVDLGAADPARHHSSASYYAWTDDEFWASGANTEALAIPVQGNFRETVYTNLAFLQTRTFFNAFCAAYLQMPVFNCSDGVMIDGAKPCRAADVPTPKPVQAKGLVARLFAQAMTPDMSETADMLQSYRHALDRFYAECRAIPVDKETDFVNLYNAMQPLLFGRDDSEPAASAAARACNAGTLLLLLQFGYAYARRLPPDERVRFTAWYGEALRGHLDGMEKMIGEVLAA
ncbi:MAG: DUF115 domain-containing protein [Alphaproteobacteria bacterium]